MKQKIIILLFMLLALTDLNAQAPLQPPSSKPIQTTKPTPGQNRPVAEQPPAQMTALFEEGLRLKDGDSLICSVDLMDAYFVQEKALSSKYTHEILSSGLLKAFGIQEHEMEITECIEFNCEGMYTSLFMLGEIWNLPNYDYYHDLIKVKEIRDFGYKLLTRLLVDYCNYYPKDFTTNVQAIVDEALAFVQDMPNHQYKIDYDKWGNGTIFVDGNELDSDFGFTVKGFILRRIYTDEVPVSEIKNFLTSLSARLKSIDKQNKSEILFKVLINNEMSFCYGVLGPFFYAERTRKKIYPLQDKHDLKLSDPKLYYTSGSDGSYYKIVNGYVTWEHEWLPHDFNDVQEMILNSNGTVLLRK